MNDAVSSISLPAAPCDRATGARPGDQGPTARDALGEGVIDREEALARYRRLREISRYHGSAVLERVSRKALLYWGKRLGLVSRKTFVLEQIEEMNLAFDLAVYSAPPGKTAPVERYRRTMRFSAGSHEAIMLDAMCRSRFSLFLVRRRHAAAGLVLDDLFRHREIWLMDEGLERTAPDGMALASRVTKPDAFHMTTGAAFPIVACTLEEAIASLSYCNGDPSVASGRNVKFIEAVYRSAVAQGLMAAMRIE